MNALGCREAKRNLAVAGAGGMQAGNGGRKDGCGLARPGAGRHQFGECLFDGHIGTQ
ncbi:Uncharacterised protein [Ralstonia mannitolilytica]|uniref:Uncharacterized protein n=1 Tax=Ralstonia mannitolilytica TaxID=105219 RepID=A0AAJ4ZLR8_9RALS|nr:hypothetical protein LMG6866_01357 [Ralstonia mannitolilytica]SUD88261.1 Uncharacterised protein [Ralstonia mannitolilytica]SUD97921.1 Uncharacterised protein [Ralstonia mannitolilytica]